MWVRQGVLTLRMSTTTTLPEVPDFSLVRFAHHGTNHCVENRIRVKHYSGTLLQLIPCLGSRVYRYIEFDAKDRNKTMHRPCSSSKNEIRSFDSSTVRIGICFFSHLCTVRNSLSTNTLVVTITTKLTVTHSD